MWNRTETLNPRDFNHGTSNLTRIYQGQTVECFFLDCGRYIWECHSVRTNGAAVEYRARFICDVDPRLLGLCSGCAISKDRMKGQEMGLYKLAS